MVEFANDLMRSGYITCFQTSDQVTGKVSELAMQVNNLFVGARRRISGLKTTLLPMFSTPTAVESIALQCLFVERCRWLHLCLMKGPYATKLEPLHVCKDENQKEFTDATFFQVLRKVYYNRQSWKQKVSYKLRKIQFVEVNTYLL